MSSRHAKYPFPVFPLLALIILLTPGCGGGGGGVSGGGASCATPSYEKVCQNDDVYWRKTCGGAEEFYLEQVCGDNKGCSDGACLRTNYWAVTFDRGVEDGARSVEQTSDGGYIAAGYTEAPGTSIRDAWVIKLDRFGREEWSKIFGGEDYDSASSIIQTSDGNYIFAASTESSGNGKTDVWLLKLDSAGNEIWSRTFGGGEFDYASTVNQTADGGYIVMGDTESYGAGENDAWIIKLDSSGNQAWAKTLGGSSDDSAHDIKLASDGGYIVRGGTDLPEPDPSNKWVVKLDANGNQLWSKSFGDTPTDAPSCPASYKEYIMTGLSYRAATYYVWVMNIDNSGNGEWAKIFEGAGYVSAATEQTFDDGFVSAGDVLETPTSDYDLFVLKLDSCGNEEWMKNYGGENDDRAFDIGQTTDGGYVVAGETKSYGIGNYNFWVLKLDSNGDCLGCF